MLTSELENVWITSDGKKFLSEKEAKIHEISLSTGESIDYWEELKTQKLESLNKNIKEKIEWLEKLQQNLQ